MKECCRETFKLALEEVLLSIKTNKISSIEEIGKALQYAILMLDSSKKESK